jgi:hypothetical protein
MNRTVLNITKSNKVKTKAKTIETRTTIPAEIKTSLFESQVTLCNSCFTPLKNSVTLSNPFINSFKKLGRSEGTRTHNPRFWRPVLYQLSYTPVYSMHLVIHSPQLYLSTSPSKRHPSESWDPVEDNSSKRSTSNLSSSRSFFVLDPSLRWDTAFGLLYNLSNNARSHGFTTLTDSKP